MHAGPDPDHQDGQPEIMAVVRRHCGVALENKYGIVFFATGVVAGLLLTEHRAMLLKPWIWLGGLLAFLIFLPNLIWNIQHHFPFFELLANIRRNGRNVPLTHLQFLGQVPCTCSPPPSH